MSVGRNDITGKAVCITASVIEVIICVAKSVTAIVSQPLNIEGFHIYLLQKIDTIHAISLANMTIQFTE